MNQSKYILLFYYLMVIACQDPKQNIDKEAKKTSIQKNEEDIVRTKAADYSFGFFLINVNATKDENMAKCHARELRLNGYKSGYLWIKDFESLSGKDLFSIFIGPFEDLDSCLNVLDQYKNIDPKAYAVKANQDKDRIVIRNRNDFRVNNLRVGRIYTFLNDKYREAFYKKIEDWGYVFNGIGGFYEMEKNKWVYIGHEFNLEKYSQKELIKLGLENLESEKYGCILLKDDKAQYIDLSSYSPDVFAEAGKFFWP
jgi:hypothetical protein